MAASTGIGLDLAASAILSVVAMALLAVDLWLIRRHSATRWPMIFAAIGLMILFDIFSIGSLFLFETTIVFALILVCLEEVAKFAACKLTGLNKPLIRFLTGGAFGLIEVAISKSQLALFGLVGPYLGLFLAFCCLTVVMHGVTALYYDIERNAALGVLAATTIHAFYNGIASQAESGVIDAMEMAVCQVLALALAVGIYWVIWRYRRRFDPTP